MDTRGYNEPGADTRGNTSLKTGWGHKRPSSVSFPEVFSEEHLAPVEAVRTRYCELVRQKAKMDQ